MLTNVLVRTGRRFDVVAGADESWARLDAWIAGVSAAVALRGARLLSVGDPIPGYLDVEVDATDLEQLGVSVHRVGERELDRAMAAVEPDAISELASRLASSSDVSSVPGDVLARGCHLSLALEGLIAETGVVGGAVNCHGPMLRGNPRVGITACLGVSCASAQGVPLACTGDLPTAAALILGRQLAGAALYCELYQLDVPGDWILVANGGEGDMSWRVPDTVRLLPEDHYPGEAGPGVAVAWRVPAGPATLLGLTPTDGGWVLVSAEGTVLDSRHHAMDGPNAMFRFGAGPVVEAFEAWCRAGATHHAVLVPGHHPTSLGVTAEILGVRHVVV